MKNFKMFWVVGALAALVGLMALAPVGVARAQGANPAQVNVAAEVAAIDDLLQQAMYAYQHGDRDGAYRLARGAYLDHFENIEIPLRVMDADLTSDMEFRF